MWFKVEDTRSSIGQKNVVRCTSEMGGKTVVEERPARGAPAARKAAELLASTLNVTATVYGKDKEGEFVYGVYEIAEGAGEASNPLVKKLFAESAAASLSLKDQLLADIPDETIKGFASLASALGYFVSRLKQIKRASTPQITYSTLFRVFCGDHNPSTFRARQSRADLPRAGRSIGHRARPPAPEGIQPVQEPRGPREPRLADRALAHGAAVVE